jgi:hypothetical protein
MVRWYQVFSYWLIGAFLLGLKVYPLFVLSLVATVLGQLYIASRGKIYYEFVFFRVMLHVVPLVLMKPEADPVHMVGLLAAYVISLWLQGKSFIQIYKNILSEPSDLTIKQYVQTRFF